MKISVLNANFQCKNIQMEILNTSHWVPRRLEAVVLARLKAMPAVAIMGPRQVGKTSLARKIAKNYSGAIFLDLETIKDRQVLGEPELFFLSTVIV